MKIVIITLFPEIFDGVIGSSILKRAQEKNLVSFEFVNLREFGIGPRKQVDDTPYGGGAGMVLRVDVMAEALIAAKLKIKNEKLKIILMTPQGERLKQPILCGLADFDGDYIIVCGHYEGFDERIRALVDEEISIGDFVLTGGELATMVLIDGITRLIPGVLGREESHQDESHSEEGRIEYPHYTRPENWDNKSVPEVLKSGNHAEIAKWREAESTLRSKKLRKVKH
jgi:tRNA (guanine37-N1)-methyltransferase